MRLSGKVALVTGAGRGIGKAIALKLASEGADVAVNDVNGENARKTAKEVEALGRRSLALVADITMRPQVEEMVQRAIKELGRIDMLVNNAGWDKLEPFIESSEETWEKVIAINLKGSIYCTRAVLDGMMERKSGKIISIASDAGKVGSMFEAVYSATKGGIIAFSKTIAREMARYNINVNVICPGPTDTALLRQVDVGPSERTEKLIDALTRAIPFKRLGQPEDVAGAVAFMASSDADYITGQALSVSGGLTMS